MLKNRIALAAVAGSAALIPIAGISALTTGVAGAAKAPKGISCTTGTGKVSASLVAKITLSGCTPTAKTGGSGKTSGSEGSTSGTIAWENSKSTTFSESTSTGTNCPSSDVYDEVITGSVTADTTKSTTVGASVSAEFCVTENAAGKIKLALAPGTKFLIGA